MTLSNITFSYLQFYDDETFFYLVLFYKSPTLGTHELLFRLVVFKFKEHGKTYKNLVIFICNEVNYRRCYAKLVIAGITTFYLVEEIPEVSEQIHLFQKIYGALLSQKQWVYPVLP